MCCERGGAGREGCVVCWYLPRLTKLFVMVAAVDELARLFTRVVGLTLAAVMVYVAVAPATNSPLVRIREAL